MTEKNQRRVFQATSTLARLAGAVFTAALVFFLSFPLELELRALLAWDLALFSYLALLAIRMTAADAEDTRILAEQKETANAFILTLA
ncbi:MAG TPA: hypothetical protein VL475_04500, partial [Planctomycetaceae bacterium]|nr:hypothetical protein [Planctomycetaceae bacterium]